jgi:D-inositol-3-phosphate glycosyltransferase
MRRSPGIALCCTTHSLGGIELNVLRLAEWMTHRGHHCSIVAADASPLHGQATRAGLPCLPLVAQSRYNVYGDARVLATQLGDRGVGSLILNINRDLLLGVLAKRLSSGTLSLIHTQHMQFGRPKLDAIHRWQHRQLDAWIAPLPSLAEQTRRMTAVPHERIHVVPLGIELPPLLDAPPQSLARKELGLPADAFIAGIVGRLDIGKGQEYLLHAASLLRAEGRDMHVLIIGEETRGEQQGYGRALNELTAALELTGQVHFRGFVENIPMAYAAMDVFTLTSLSETYGMVTIEAMAAGRPVVATDSGGTPELVAGSDAAFLVPPRDPKSLAEAISRLMDDRGLAARMGERGREHASTHFGHETQCEAIEQLLERIHV